MKKLLLLLTLGTLFIGFNGYSQCTGSTPLFIVDLSSSPTATWTSPSVARNGSCCADNNCVAFLITLNPAATEISLTISSGAIPTGSLFYQVGCGGLQSVGSITCISGVGPHLITFCKPGNNVNTYTIASNPVSASPDFSMMEGTTASLWTTGLTAGSVNWTSIYPGIIGAYNSYLSCANCSNPIITAPIGAPPLVKYAVTGTAVSGCLPLIRNDTVNVTILDAPLPISLVGFGGKYDPITNTNNLWWQTATETNNIGFIVEKSSDAINWNNIGEVDGHGNSNTFHSYNFTDDQPLSVGYYRLKQKDKDGSSNTYNPISINTTKTEPIEWIVYPNPANGNFTVQFNRVIDGKLQLMDNMGRIIIDQTIYSQQKFQIESILPGCYTLTLETEGEVLQQKIIIQ